MLQLVDYQLLHLSISPLCISSLLCNLYILHMSVHVVSAFMLLADGWLCILTVSVYLFSCTALQHSKPTTILSMMSSPLALHSPCVVDFSISTSCNCSMRSSWCERSTAWRPQSLGCTDLHHIHINFCAILTVHACSTAWRPRAGRSSLLMRATPCAPVRSPRMRATPRLLSRLSGAAGGPSS